MLDKVNLITPSAFAGTATRKIASKEIISTMGTIMVGVIAAGVLGISTNQLVAGGLGA